MPEDYEPYGDEWRSAMMQMTKSQLVDFIKRILSKGPNTIADQNRRDVNGKSF